MKVDSQAKVANLNSDELDGLDSNEFMREPGYAPWVNSDSDSSRHKVVTAPCPSGNAPIGGSARITATSGPGADSEVPVALTVSEAAGSSGWRAEAQEIGSFDGDSYLLVDPICVVKDSGVVLAGRLRFSALILTEE
ncbi:MAG TPA: hypothetical protein VJ827_11640 [Rubrobacter sp.]|nr:hypothetical protein [Rubrobacter sp.]